MNRDLKALSNETFDVLVIGGGITGACIALDAQTRGLKTALIEKGDFGGATSAASSKLLHGGIRYLQQGRLDKVMESAKERAIFQNLAPHLTQYVPFIIPTYQRPFMKTQLAMGIGLQCYEWLCWKANRQIAQATKKVPPNARLTRKELLEITPLLQSEQELTGARVL
jgi:glycerol-3-phosphate dehydrogenase